MLIVIEGQDAAGKDTQAKLLEAYLKEKGETVVSYDESGTSSLDPFVSEISNLNYKNDYSLDKKTHVLLYLVNRYEQWKRLAEPTLKENGVVILTRNWLSTLIYEGYGTGVSRSLIKRLHREIMPEKYFSPDKIAILTLPEAERKKRLIFQGKRSEEFFKSKKAEFQKTLNSAYLKVAKEFNVPTLDASGSREEVLEKLKTLFKI